MNFISIQIRNRHLAEWRFLRVTRNVKVKSPIWNVIVTGIKLTPSRVV